MTTFVLVPGACHGGWYYDELAARLRTHGHRALTVTLTGVAERAHLAHACVNLETHIADLLAELDANRVTDAVLVGHSYGGMVITAAADRAAAHVDSLVYLDAFVPGRASRGTTSPPCPAPGRPRRGGPARWPGSAQSARRRRSRRSSLATSQQDQQHIVDKPRTERGIDRQVQVDLPQDLRLGHVVNQLDVGVGGDVAPGDGPLQRIVER